jgi:hypothetical protein
LAVWSARTASKSIHATWHEVGNLGPDAEHTLVRLFSTPCPACRRHIIVARFNEAYVSHSEGGTGVRERDLVLYPRGTTRPPPPPEVPNPFAQDYKEACAVLADSPKASAALSRRCLQAILREKAGVKHSNLNNEIDEAMRELPRYLSGAIDAVRNVGNFASHPMKSQSTGEVVEVEPGEAEWLLDVLEGLFAFYFVEPAALEEKRDALNSKLEDLGKPPLKEPPPTSVSRPA